MTLDAGDDAYTDHLRTAVWAAISDTDVLAPAPADRPIVLAALLEARLGLRRGNPEAPNPVQESPHSSGPILPAPDDPIGRIASTMRISSDFVELVYDFDGGDLGVVLSARRLASNKANATRELAQIVVGGRQAAGLEEWTSVSEVRKVVSDYGKFDQSNFASQVQGGGLDEIFLYRGKGATRELKVTRPGMEAIADLITKLAGTSG